MNKESAAIFLQSLWRGYSTRRANEKPVTKRKRSYLAYPVGNEAVITVEKHHKQNSGKFTMVGCSIFKNLEIINELINWDEYQFPDFEKNPMNNIPKLFIIDSSIQVYNFWDFTKKLISKTERLNDFLQSYKACFDANTFKNFITLDIEELLETHPPLYQTLSKHFHEVETFFEKICIPSPEQFDASDFSSYSHGDIESQDTIRENKFNFFKNIILNATIIQEDLVCEDAFYFIQKYIPKNRSEQPLYFYASNVLEYCSWAIEMRNQYDITFAQRMIDNIDSLEPNGIFHTRSRRARPPTLHPNKALMIFSNSVYKKENHLEALEASNATCLRIKGLNDFTKNRSRVHPNA